MNLSVSNTQGDPVFDEVPPRLELMFDTAGNGHGDCRVRSTSVCGRDARRGAIGHIPVLLLPNKAGVLGTTSQGNQ